MYWNTFTPPPYPHIVITEKFQFHETRRLFFAALAISPVCSNWFALKKLIAEMWQHGDSRARNMSDQMITGFKIFLVNKGTFVKENIKCDVTITDYLKIL